MYIFKYIDHDGVEVVAELFESLQVGPLKTASGETVFVDRFTAEQMESIEDVTGVAGIAPGWRKIEGAWQAPPPTPTPPSPNYAFARVDVTNGVASLIDCGCPNAQGLEHLGPGDFRITFAMPFSDTSYGTNITLSWPAALVQEITPNTNTVRIQFWDLAQVPTDPASFTVECKKARR